MQGPASAAQSADSLQSLSASIDEMRGNAAAKNRVKKLRKKRAALAKQAVSAALQSGSGDPPNKRRRLAEEGSSLQYGGRGGGGAAGGMHPAGHAADSDTHAVAAAQHLHALRGISPAGSAVPAPRSPQPGLPLQRPAAAASGEVGCPPAQRTLQPPPMRGRGAHADLSLLATLIAVQQPPGALQGGPSAACEPGASDGVEGAGAWMPAQTSSLHTGGEASPSASGPCRTDLSGELALVGQRMQAAAGRGAPATTSRPAGAAAAAAARGEGGSAGCPRQLPPGGGKGRGKGKSAFIYGNYHNYYSYRKRVGDAEHDPRLAVLDPAWFRGGDCLDIGCNEGLVTLDMAALFGTRSMQGVDIDGFLIKRAVAHLASVRAAMTAQAHAVPDHMRRQPEYWQTVKRLKALAKVKFVYGDWMLLACKSGRYDVITCFSVTKWVHINQGDEGLRRLFAKMHRCLASGGVLVLEPQPWRSYVNAKHKQDLRGVAYWDCEQLQLRPNGFVAHLTEQLGFQLLGSFRVGTDKVENKGWDRPIYVLRKPATEQGDAGAAHSGAAAGGGAAAAAAGAADAAAAPGGSWKPQQQPAASRGGADERPKGRKKQRRLEQEAATQLLA